MKTVRLGFLAATLALAPPGAAPLAAQTDFARFPIGLATVNSGPGELAREFYVSPLAGRYWEIYNLAESDLFSQIMSGAHPMAGPDWLADNIDDTWISHALDMYGIASGVGGAAGATWRGGWLQRLGTGLGHVSIGLTVAKVTYDLARGAPGSAAYSAALGTAAFYVGAYGTPGVQLVALAALVTEWAVRESFWAFVAAHDEARLAAPLSAYDRYFAERRQQRGADEWYTIVQQITRDASDPQAAADALEREIATYIRRPWSDPYFWEEVLPDGGWRTWGIVRFPEIRASDRALIEARAREQINETLNTVVFPRIAQQLWEGALQRAVDEANIHLRPILNELWELTIVAYDIDAPTQFTLRVPGHRGWSGTLEPGVPRVVHISTLAILRANQRSGEFRDTRTLVESGPGWIHTPREIELETPQGTMSQIVIWDANRRATVRFSEPEALYVMAYRREEGEQSCTRSWQHPGQPETRESLSLPPRPTGILHMGVDGRLQLVIGQFSASEGWIERSFGASDGANLLFSPPLFDDINAMESCEAELFMGVLFERARCTVRRISDREEMVPAPSGRQGLCIYEGASGGMRMVIPCADPPAPTLETGGEPLLLRDFEAPPDRVQTLVREECSAPIRIELQGAFMRDDDHWHFIDFQGEAGQMMREAIREGMRHGVYAQ